MEAERSLHREGAMEAERSLHSICRWSFHAGAGGFLPPDARPEWSPDRLDTRGVAQLIAREIQPRLPEHVELGLELHYDYEVDEAGAVAVADSLLEAGLHLALITPGAHRRFAYGGIASLDPGERRAAEDFGRRTVDLVYGPLRRTWHPDPEDCPALVIWNGSFGYDIATAAVREMYRNLCESLARLCAYEEDKGGGLYLALEPKPNEGHPAMLIPTAASGIVLWKKLADDFGVDLSRKGINKEFGHSQMIGLDPLYDTVEEVENGMLVHMHLNSQGYDNGITLGGPGRFDIDQALRINGTTVAIAGLARQAGFRRWKGHDIQPRPYDDAGQAIDRVVRSILAWEACAAAERELDYALLGRLLAERRTADAEDLMHETVAKAHAHFDEWYARS